jgi:hypothetical protein
MIFSHIITGIFIVLVLFVIVLSIIFAKGIFREIKENEPEFFVNHLKSNNTYFSYRTQLTWGIIFGKYRYLKNHQLKKRCRIVRILSIVYILLFLLLAAIIIVRISSGA